MGFSLVVDPARRRQEYGTATIRAIVDLPDLSPIRLFFRSVEADNIASIRRLMKAGLRLRTPEPDFEGMVHCSTEK